MQPPTAVEDGNTSPPYGMSTVNSRTCIYSFPVLHFFYDVKTETPTKLKFAAAAAGRGKQRSAGLASQKMDAAPFLQQLSGAHPVEQEEESRQDQGLC